MVVVDGRGRGSDYLSTTISRPISNITSISGENSC